MWEMGGTGLLETTEVKTPTLSPKKTRRQGWGTRTRSDAFLCAETLKVPPLRSRSLASVGMTGWWGATIVLCPRAKEGLC